MLVNPTPRDGAHFSDIHFPGTHVRVQGDIVAHELVLGVGRGEQVTLQPPDVQEEVGDLVVATGQIPFEKWAGDSYFPARIMRSPFPSAVATRFDGVTLADPPRMVFKVPIKFRALPAAFGSYPNGAPLFTLWGASGRIAFDAGVSGQVDIAALGDITARGHVDIHPDLYKVLETLGAVHLLGTG